MIFAYYANYANYAKINYANYANYAIFFTGPRSDPLCQILHEGFERGVQG